MYYSGQCKEQMRVGTWKEYDSLGNVLSSVTYIHREENVIFINGELEAFKSDENELEDIMLYNASPGFNRPYTNNSLSISRRSRGKVHTIESPTNLPFSAHLEYYSDGVTA